MRESSAYQLILEEGRIGELQETLLRLGRIRFGPASNIVQARAQGVADLNRLRRMSERLLTAGSWDDLLQAQ